MKKPSPGALGGLFAVVSGIAAANEFYTVAFLFFLFSFAAFKKAVTG